MKKRGRKKGQLKTSCKLRHCSRCKDRLWNGNGTHIAGGGFASYCNKCNTIAANIKNWKKKTVGEILSQIWWYDHMTNILYETLEKKGR